MRLWYLLATLVPTASPVMTLPGELEVEACVQVALRQSPELDRVQAQIKDYQARLFEVESVFYPKLSGLALLAPMFTVHGSGFERTFERRWRSFRDWGPYTSVQLLLAQPLYTFERAASGKKAALARVRVEQARLRLTRGQVALEVRRLFYSYLFAHSIAPILEGALSTLRDARGRAEAMYAKGTGEVTRVDLAKLDYGTSEAHRLLLVARDGARLALMALQHTMGIDIDPPIKICDVVLQELDEKRPPLPSLPQLLWQAARDRPEWAQLAYGHEAALKLAQAERLANMPLLFLAGSMNYAYTPTRDTDDNPWHVDTFNTLTGGAALGLKIDLDPALALAKTRQALAKDDEMVALQRFATTGIPLQVRKAYDDVNRAVESVEINRAGLTATKQWMTSAATAYHSGTGEARDLLEGLAAFVQAKRSYLEALEMYYVNMAELTFAVGGI